LSKITISQLYIYPIKSCGANAVDSVFVEQYGLKGDREYMLVNSNGMFITQRQYPMLATVFPIIVGDDLHIHSSVRGKPMISVGKKQRGDWIKVRVWDAQMKAQDMGEEAGKWFSTLLDVKGIRLTRFGEESYRSSQLDLNISPVAFQDNTQLHVVTEESLRALNVLASGSANVSVARFRPNVVLTGTNAPWVEHSWVKLNMRGLLTRVVDHTFRCKIITVNQQTGEITSEEPLKTLSFSRTMKRRTQGGKGVAFGIYCNVEWGSGETIFKGQEVTPVKEK